MINSYIGGSHTYEHESKASRFWFLKKTVYLKTVRHEVGKNQKNPRKIRVKSFKFSRYTDFYWKSAFLQGPDWKSAYHENLQGLHSLRPCISMPCCFSTLRAYCPNIYTVVLTTTCVIITFRHIINGGHVHPFTFMKTAVRQLLLCSIKASGSSDLRLKLVEFRFIKIDKKHLRQGGAHATGWLEIWLNGGHVHPYYS